MTFLVDLTELDDLVCNDTLEHIAKALSDDPGDSIWDAHPSPLVRTLVELFSKRGLLRVETCKKELLAWLGGARHKPTEKIMPRPTTAMARWSKGELDLVKLYLQSLPRSAFTVDDWMMLVDYTVQRYLPLSDLRSEAEWLATRSNLMGRVAAAVDKMPSEAQAEALAAKLPNTVGEAVKTFDLSAREKAILEYGRARCCENVAAVSDAMRARMRRFIMDYTEAEMLGDKVRTAESLQTQLLDTFGTMNRDWRRIAITEATENLNQGFVASMPVGARLKRIEKYRGACDHCRAIDGKIVTVADPADPKKDGATQVWPGKTNIGRSASPRKRVGTVLVERTKKERFWIATGAQHPNCRGSWLRLGDPTRKVDPKFSDWMDEILKRK